MRYLLDTSVLLGPRPDPLDGELAISAVSLAELHFGVLVASEPTERAQRLHRLGLVERHFEALPVDADVSRVYGRIAAAIADAGQGPRLRAFDLLIAATAIVHDARLVTWSAADFAGLRDHVEVINLA
jgi:hypothetical protein